MNIRQETGWLVLATLALGLPLLVKAQEREVTASYREDEFRRAILAHLVDLGYQVSDQDGVLFIGPIKP